MEPSFARRDVEEVPSARARSWSFQVDDWMFQRFIPQTSEMSMGAMRPRKIEARKDDTRDIRWVEAYAPGCLRRKRMICGPVKRYTYS